MESALFNPATGAFEPQRTPTKFITGKTGAAGPTALWTPALGKRFRLLGFTFAITNDATVSVAGEVDITLSDGGTAIGLAATFYVPGSAIGGLITAALQGLNLTGNGYPSLALNNPLNVTLSAALTAGNIRYNLWGTEEVVGP